MSQSRPVKALNKLESIVIEGEDVTVTTSNDQPAQMKKADFIRLYGEHFLSDLPEDKRIQMDFDDKGDAIVSIDGERPYETTKYRFAQKLGQAVMSYVEAGAAAYAMQQIVPYVGYSGFAMTGLVLDTARELVSKEKPFNNYFYAEGDGSYLRGFVKIGASNVAAYSLVVAADMSPISLSVMGNTAIETLNAAMNEPAFQMLMLGTAGYLGCQYVRWSSKKALEYCLPAGYKEEIKVDPDLNLLQLLGQYGLRWLRDEVTTEAVLYLVSTFGSQALAENMNFQIGMLLASDVTLQMGNYFAYTPYPVKQLLPQRQRGADLEEGGQAVAENKFLLYPMTRKGILLSVMCASVYLVHQLTLSIIDSYDPAKENTSGGRAIRFGAALGVPFALGYLAQAAPKVLPKISSCWGSIFNRGSSQQQRPEEQRMLVDDAALDNQVEERLAR